MYYNYGDHNIIADFFAGTFLGRYGKDMNRVGCVLECPDGKHSLSVTLGASARSSKNVYVDGEHVALIKYKGHGIVPFMTHKIECGGDEVMLVFYANSVEIIHGGVGALYGKKYRPHGRIPEWCGIILSLITLLSLSVTLTSGLRIGGSLGGLACIITGMVLSLICTALVLRLSSDPFSGAVKKLFTVLTVIAAWAIQYATVYVVNTAMSM